MPILGLVKSAWPLDQSGDSLKVPQPQLAQKLCLTVLVCQR
jgi:hypothetical protein